MAMYVDTAVLEDARWTLRLPPVTGLTLNPVLVSRALNRATATHSQYEAHLQALADLISPDGHIFVQTLGSTASDIEAEARRLLSVLVGDGHRKISTSIKIPLTEEGLLATRSLSATKVSVAVTGVFTPEQAYLAAASGAEYVIPYVSRIEPASDPLQVIKDMGRILEAQGLTARVLAASVKSLSDLAELLLMPRTDVTVPPELIRQIFDHEDVLDAVNRFAGALTLQ